MAKFQVPRAPLNGYEIDKGHQDDRFEMPFWRVEHASKHNLDGPRMWVQVMDPAHEARSNWTKLLYLSHEYKDPDLNEALPFVLAKRDEMEVYRGVGFLVTFYAPASIRDHLVRNVTRWTMAAKGLRVSQAADYYVPEGSNVPSNNKSSGEEALTNYKVLCDNGERYQDARGVAPFNAMVRWTMGLSYQTLVYIFKARTWLVGADPDTKRLVSMLWDIVYTSHPELWDCIYEYYGPATIYGNRAMRNLRERDVTIRKFIERLLDHYHMNDEIHRDALKGLPFEEVMDGIGDESIWDFIMDAWGKPPKDTWNA